jgi:hypothetical protein
MNKVKYIHFRAPLCHQSILENGRRDKKVAIWLSPSMFGGATVRIEQVGADKFTVSTAFCSPKDNFCRKTGRAEADKGNITEMCRNDIALVLDLVWEEMQKVCHIPRKQRRTRKEFREMCKELQQ